MGCLPPDSESEENEQRRRLHSLEMNLHCLCKDFTLTSLSLIVGVCLNVNWSDESLAQQDSDDTLLQINPSRLELGLLLG
jgi:hypothetical protein